MGGEEVMVVLMIGSDNAHDDEWNWQPRSALKH